MSRHASEEMFVLGFKTKNNDGEEKIFALKNPRRFTLVDMSSGGKVKKFSTIKTAKDWLNKLLEKKIPELKGIEIIKVKREERINTQVTENA